MSALLDVSVAFCSVATSEPMPRWRDYRQLVELNRPSSHTFTSVDRPTCLRGEHTEFGAVTAAELVAAVVSFSDDHNRSNRDEVLPHAWAEAFIEALASQRALQSERAAAMLTPDAQLEIANSLTHNVFYAVLVCHLATRQLARGRDNRLFDQSRIASLTLEERVDIGQAIAPFPESVSMGGDPLGDTYHYWANVAVGMFARASPFARQQLLRGLMWSGPCLMTAVREKAFGSVLFYGNHAAIDRLGFAHGFTD